MWGQAEKVPIHGQDRHLLVEPRREWTGRLRGQLLGLLAVQEVHGPLRVGGGGEDGLVVVL